jgi:hypothetical protein
MLTSMKLALFTTLAALSIAGAPGAATIEPGPSTSISAAPSPANFTVEAQARVLRKCEEDLGYGRTGSFGCGWSTMPGLGRAAPARRPLNRDQRAVMPLINNIIGKMEACEAIEERRQLRALMRHRACWFKLNIDPIPIALRLWQQTRTDGDLAHRRFFGRSVSRLRSVVKAEPEAE